MERVHYDVRGFESLKVRIVVSICMAKKHILITGITGFVGSHLAEYLLAQKNMAVFGSVLSHHLGDELKRIAHIKNHITLLEGDLSHRNTAARIVHRAKPDIIFHLAAQSFVPQSWESPEDTLHNNISAELNIFEAVREAHLNPIIHIAGSSEQYGLVHARELPIKETNPFRPLSPYAVSKVAQEMLGYQYHKSYGLKIVLTRAFNHEGPRRGKQFVTSDFASQIAAIEAGKQIPVMHVGNLSAYRDFTDVRDMVRAYALAVKKCAYGEPYNIGSGKAWKIKDMLAILLSFSSVPIKIMQDPVRMRPSDVPILQCDSSKFRKATGWKSTIPFEKTLLDTLNYWRGEYGTKI
jgi:GDP-4-dehydro-6-deoxy-D-mannose reductase